MLIFKITMVCLLYCLFNSRNYTWHISVERSVYVALNDPDRIEQLVFYAFSKILRGYFKNDRYKKNTCYILYNIIMFFFLSYTIIQI